MNMTLKQESHADHAAKAGANKPNVGAWSWQDQEETGETAAKTDFGRGHCCPVWREDRRGRWFELDHHFSFLFSSICRIEPIGQVQETARQARQDKAV